MDRWGRLGAGRGRRVAGVTPASAMIGGMLRVLRGFGDERKRKRGENDRRKGLVRSRETTESREGLVDHAGGGGGGGGGPCETAVEARAPLQL